VDEVKIVPARAVLYVLGSNKAFVVNQDVIEAREVKVGDRVGQQLEILEGLQEGETVAITQLARLDTGSKIRVVAPKVEDKLSKAEPKPSE